MIQLQTSHSKWYHQTIENNTRLRFCQSIVKLSKGFVYRLIDWKFCEESHRLLIVIKCSNYFWCFPCQRKQKFSGKPISWERVPSSGNVCVYLRIFNYCRLVNWYRVSFWSEYCPSSYRKSWLLPGLFYMP